MNPGRVVRILRKARGLSATEVAQRMGITQVALSYLETGRNSWRSNMIFSAAHALGVRPFLLLMSDSERRRAMLIFG